MEENEPFIESEFDNIEENKSDYSNSKKPKSKILTIILLVIAALAIMAITPLILILIFMGIVSYGQKDAPKVEDYQIYLEEKYGTDKGFYHTGEGNCNWFETGECSHEFSSNELNGASFTVTSERKYYDNNKTEYIFWDDYETRKNFEKLKPKYYEFLNSVMPYDYQLELEQFSFMDIPTLYIYVKYNNIPDIEKIDSYALRASILGAIPEQYQNIDIKFEVIVYAGSGVSYGYLKKCPEFFDSGSYSNEGADSCSFSIK